MIERDIERVRDAIGAAIKASNERECADLPLRDLAEAAIKAMQPSRPFKRSSTWCLSCVMPNGKHDEGCPYEGKTHVQRPKQEDDDW